MNDVVGVELGTVKARAAAFGAWRARPHEMVELPWNPTRPADLVAALRERFGPTRRIGLSVGLGFLHVKHVKLPPAPAAERRRMLALEPDRFFPVQDQQLVVSLASEADFAFAIDAGLLDSWITAFSAWGIVDGVEPAPLSLGRALGATAQGSFSVDTGDDEHGIVELADGAFRSARRVPAAAAAPSPEPPPQRDGIAGEYLCAVGAARGVNAPLETMLLPDASAARVRGRRAGRLVFTGVTCAVAFVLALWSIDRARERTLTRITEEIARVAPQATTALELNERIAVADREVRATADLTTRRGDPLTALIALGKLPAGATVLNLRAVGADWQIDGRATDAAGIVSHLAAHPHFEDVRFLSASSRFREDNRTYETFSIAFRVRPPT